MHSTWMHRRQDNVHCCRDCLGQMIPGLEKDFRHIMILSGLTGTIFALLPYARVQRVVTTLIPQYKTSNSDTNFLIPDWCPACANCQSTSQYCSKCLQGKFHLLYPPNEKVKQHWCQWIPCPTPCFYTVQQ